MKYFAAARAFLFVTASCLLGQSALAWDPNAGAEPTPPQRPYARYLPSHAVAPRYYNPAAVNRAPISSPAPVAVAPEPLNAPVAPAAYAAPAAITAAPLAAPHVAAAPAYTPAPSYQPVHTYNAPAYNAAAVPASNALPKDYKPYPSYGQTTTVYDAHRFEVGVDGFIDFYREPDTFPDLNERAYYGSLDLGYEYQYSPRYYLDIEQRVSRGSSRYKSSQGHIADIPQWEFESRIMAGMINNISSQRRLSYYMGLGSRYLLDQSKGKVTSGGSVAANAYERRIFQLYIPIGVTYEFPAYGMTFAPNIEIDPIFYGNVQSRLQNIPGQEVFNNRQNKGIGLRGEFMMGQHYDSGFGWQFGPFVRYWDVPDSELDFNGTGGGMEPRNTRLQTGAKLKLQF